VSKASVFATIVVEKIIDMFSLVILLSLTLLIYPFPHWVKKSGIIMLVISGIALMLLILLKVYENRIIKVIEFVVKPLPVVIHDKILKFTLSFTKGLNQLNSGRDYLYVLLSTILIWVFYIFLFYINFYTFELTGVFNLTLFSSLVIMVITTISIVIPSSPGYIGTFHWLCQLSLGMFNIPRETGLSYAIILHALNYIPVLLFGILLAWREGVHFSSFSDEEMSV
jgi:uncharacterized membrane protein YbhN (UPF0104 family)